MSVALIDYGAGNLHSVHNALKAAGATDLLIDLSDVTYLGSSGLVALHSLALLLAGREPPDPEMGWSAFHGLSVDVNEGGSSGHIRLINPQPQVDRTLEIAGAVGDPLHLVTIGQVRGKDLDPHAVSRAQLVGQEGQLGPEFFVQAADGCGGGLGDSGLERHVRPVSAGV